MHKAFLMVAVVALASPPLQAQVARQITTPQEAQDWYVDMMIRHSCEMTATEVADAIEADFPYTHPVSREDHGMVTDAGIDMAISGVIVAIRSNRIRYTGPGC